MTPADEPADQPAEHESGLRCERHVRRHADDDAHRQAQHGPERDRGQDAHPRESKCRLQNDRSPRGDLSTDLLDPSSVVTSLSPALLLENER